MPRQKISFPSTSMVCHVWAQQTQEEGHHTNHGNKQAYFEGPKLWSYGYHYLVGIILPDGTALINDTKNSKTTNGILYEAWGAVSHRKRHRLPSLTDFSRTLQTLEGAKGKEKKHVQKRIRAYVAEHALEIQSEAGCYLLSLTSNKFVTRDYTRMCLAARKAIDNAEEAKTKATRKDRLAYASKVSKLVKDEKKLVEGLANVCAGSDHKVSEQAKLLRNAHLAAKAAKRDKQAKDVWRVLQLVRAEIKLREKQNARKESNRDLKRYIENLRNKLKDVKIAADKGESISAWTAEQIHTYAGLLYHRIPSATKAKLEHLGQAFDAVSDVIREIERAKEIERKKEQIAGWLAGEPGASRFDLYSIGKTLLRAVDVTRDASGKITGGNLETSQGAEVPLTHAIKAFRFLKLCRERENPHVQGWLPKQVVWQSNGHSVRVGHFGVDRVFADGSFKAGCHEIGWDEVERLARQLGVFNDTPSDDAVQPTAQAA